MYSFRSRLGPVDLAFTDRYGGVSRPPYDSLNLAFEGGDDPGACAENLRLTIGDFARDLVSRGDFCFERQVAQMRQVHGAEVDVVEHRRLVGSPEADALMTTRADVVLVVRAADCVPIVLADPDAGIVAAVHCGRPGLVAGVVPAAAARMRRSGATRITAWVGPHVCGACYEVPEQLQREVGSVAPEAVSTTSWGTPSLDIGAGVRAQLGREGVAVEDVSRCTRESADLYSYRRDGAAAGRLAGLVRLRA